MALQDEQNDESDKSVRDEQNRLVSSPIRSPTTNKQNTRSISYEDSPLSRSEDRSHSSEDRRSNNSRGEIRNYYDRNNDYHRFRTYDNPNNRQYEGRMSNSRERRYPDNRDRFGNSRDNGDLAIQKMETSIFQKRRCSSISE